MLYIVKNPIEPHQLVEERLQIGVSSYDDLSTETKDAIRKSLLIEQGYLCAYCMKRISVEDTTIEHYDPQSAQNGTDMSYRNMLGVCDGGQKNQGKGSQRLTCDKRRGNRPLTINPLDNYTISKVKYTKKGGIYSDDENINFDLNNTLNLNSPNSYLKANRETVYDTLIKKIDAHGGKNRSFLLRLKREYETKDSDGKYTPFAGIALYFINKWLNSC